VDQVSTYIVLTTINVPTLIEGYAENFLKYERSNVGFIIIGDLITPHEKTRQIIQNVKNKGFDAEYYDIASQKKWLRNFPQISKIIPYRTDNRRNIGFLMAAEKGAKTLIAIDDDNYAGDDDFYKCHSIVGKKATLPTVTSSNGWFNPCTMLETDHGGLIYPRGYPFSKRRKEQYTFTQTTGQIALNMGLWTADPDADAVTHLANPTQIVRMEDQSESIMLAPGTYAPINTQNTALDIKALPCYYYILMNASLRGMKIDRYGDIWSGFLIKKAIDQMNERAVVGRPMVVHRRNSHNYLKDLKSELWGMLLTEEIVKWLEQLQLESDNYFDIYLEMANGLKKLKEGFAEYAIRKYLEKIANAMNVWVDACRKILYAD
jgi:predicted house-cleaning noncanonical NTP pyrophosphatase (MazG superfamily)